MTPDLTGEIASIVAALPGLPDLDGFWDDIDARIAGGDPGFAADVAIALRATYGRQPVQHVASAVDGLLRRLALLPWPGHVAEVVRMAAGAGVSTRYVASLLAAGQDAADLGPVLDAVVSAAAPAGLRACLIQELVLRGTRHPAPMPAGHPLSVLPGIRADLEGDPPLPRYGLDWTGHSSPFQPVPGDPAAAGPLPPFLATPGPQGADAAFATWTNSTVEPRTIDLVEPLRADALAASAPAVVAALDLVCRAELPAGTPVTGAACEPETVWRLLFAAASMGGAHSYGEYGAHGRLAAWRSLGALTGAGQRARVADIERRARDCAWYRFRVDDRVGPDGSGAFHDVGLVALTPGGHRIAVVAAMDVDRAALTDGDRPAAPG